MARRASSKNELIRCEYCGEMYASSYKHCPFCNEDGTGRWTVPDEDDEEVSGGKRLASGGGKRTAGRQGPSVRRIISMVVSLALIIAAAGIVISIVRSLTETKPPKPASTPTAAPTMAAATAEPTAPAVLPSAPAPEVTVPVTSQPVPSQPALPTVTSPVASLTVPTSFRLNRDDFTFDAPGQTFQMKATFTPENAQSEVTWKSSNPNVASVSWNGVVTAVSKGTVTLTATVEGVGEKTCIVRCNFTSGSAPAASTTTAPATSKAPAASKAPSSSSGSLKLSRDDFTLKENEKWRLTVSGTGSAVSWSSTNEAVATVSADGTVSAVGKGTCKVKAVVDGQTLECIVRCSW